MTSPNAFIVLPRPSLDIPNLGAELAAQLATELGRSGLPHVDVVDILEVLVDQAAALAASQSLSGAARVALHLGPNGGGQVNVETEQRSIGQGLDPERLEAKKAARRAIATAASRAAARKKVADLVKTVAQKAAAVLAPPAAAKPSATATVKSPLGTSPASRPTLPPPRRN